MWLEVRYFPRKFPCCTRRGFDFAVRGKNVLMGSIGKDQPRLPAGVEYLEFEMKEDESTPPRSVEESATQPNSVRLLSGHLKPGGVAKPSLRGGDLQSAGWGLLFWGLGLALASSATQSAL